jgi:ligand-binding SRPBCC domain-containing protein
VVSTVSFSLQEGIAAPRERVYAHLSEPASFLGLQPLLIEVTETGRGEDGSGRPTRTFRSVEKLRLFGFLPWRNAITTRMTLTQPNQRIECEVDSPGGVRLRNAFVLCDEGGESVVRDEVTIECPRLLAGFVLGEARKAHERLLSNLKKRMEEQT